MSTTLPGSDRKRKSKTYLVGDAEDVEVLEQELHVGQSLLGGLVTSQSGILQKLFNELDSACGSHERVSKRARTGMEDRQVLTLELDILADPVGNVTVQALVFNHLLAHIHPRHLCGQAVADIRMSA